MEQLGIFITLIKDHWMLSALITLSVLILIGEIFKGLSGGMKIIFFLMILMVFGVAAFTLITFFG